MGTLVIHATPGARIRVEQVRHEFWFGATLPGGIFAGRNTPEDIARWKEVFLSHFNAGVPEADFKWDVMERQQGQVNYSVVDSMVAWAQKEGVSLRGHCIFWGVPNHVQSWLKEMSDDDFKAAVAQRGRTVAARYHDKFSEYDLNNEMMHANYYEDRFGIGFIRQMALWVKEGDPGAKLFVNDYDITTGNRLDDYVKHIRKLAGRRRAPVRYRRAGPFARRFFRFRGFAEVARRPVAVPPADSHHRVQFPRPAIQILHRRSQGCYAA